MRLPFYLINQSGSSNQLSESRESVDEVRNENYFPHRQVSLYDVVVSAAPMSWKGEELQFTISERIK